MKKITLFIWLFAITLGFSQTTKIAKLTFETAPADYGPETTDISYTANTSDIGLDEYSDINDGSTGKDYFTRTPNGDAIAPLVPQISTTYTYTKPVDLGDYFFAAQDIDNGDTNPPATAFASVSLNDIDISNYENLELRVYLASIGGEVGGDLLPRGWDNRPTNVPNGDDYVHFNYSIDSGTFDNLLWIESDKPEGDTTASISGEPAIDTNFDGTGNGTYIVTTFTQFTVPLAGAVITGSTLDIVIEFNLNNGYEDIAIDNIEIWGDPITCSATDVTWIAGAWDNASGPTINDPVVIDDDYSTSTDGGSFSACSLEVLGQLTIADGDYVEVETNVIVDGTLTVENHGTFIQNDDNATFTNNGTSKVIKSTDVLENWYDYTYWSSPIDGLTIGTSPLATSNRRFWYNANNYEDILKEDLGNVNTFTTGSDGIDDNGDDWQFANNSTTMLPGVGYIASHIQAGFTTGSYDYEFSGEFNNGIITAPVYYNALNTEGHWNLIGNPYSSALDFDALVTNNPGIIDGVAYLWSQATDHSSGAIGNEASNFSSADYIIINSGSGSVNNSPGTLLEYIPSGQSFFIASLATGNVTFNNSMRVKNGASNGQFFKNSRTKNSVTIEPNKIWINLTTDAGGFNQVLIAYIDGATNNYDGMSYDAPRNLSSGVGSIIYTLIADRSDKKFAIQGKSTTSINEDEVIPLGFFTSFETVSIYSLSIQHLQGDFLTTNTVYLKDNLQNKIHNLSESDYSFTSETGEYNNRFEIVFNSNALLSTNDTEITNHSLQIINLDNNRVTFKAANNSLTIKNVTIYDLYGRKLYDFEGKNNSETYLFSSLNDAPYIARIELSNNAIVTKKFINH